MSEHHQPGVALNAPPPGYAYAGPWIRFGALIIDGVIFAAAMIALLVVCGLIRDHLVPSIAPSLRSSLIFSVSTGPAKIAVMVFAVVVTLGWYAVWQSATGSSPGMKMLRLRVIGSGREGNPTLVQAAIRNAPVILVAFARGSWEGGGWDTVLYLVPGATYIAIAISIDRNPECQGWHDRLAGGTHVLKKVAARQP